MKLIRSIATVSFFTIASRIFGFIRTKLTASFIGVGAEADALSIAIKFPSLLRRLFAEGAMNTAFVPIFAGILAKEGRENARTTAEHIFSILVLILGLLVLIAEVFMPTIIKTFFWGFTKTPERLELVIQFTRITFPFIFFISLTALYSGILNSMEKFVAVASSPMVGNIGIIATVFTLSSLTPSPGFAFAAGIAICGIIQFLWVFIPVVRSGMGLRLRIPKMTQPVKKFFLIMGPAAAGSGVVQINILLDMVIGSHLPVGSISILEYADRLNQLPLSVIGIAVGTALLPLLSKQLRLDDLEGARDSQNLALEYALLLTLPATIGLFFLAEPIIKILFEGGAFSAANTTQTAYTLMAFSAGLPAYILIKILSTTFFARQDTKTPVIIASIAVVLNLILNLLLMKPLAHIGLALSTAISAWVNAGLLAYRLRKQGFFTLTPRFKQFLPRLGLSGGLTIGIISAIKPLIISMLFHGFMMQLLCFFTLIVGGLGSFIVIAKLTGALDLKDLKFQLSASS